MVLKWSKHVRLLNCREFKCWSKNRTKSVLFYGLKYLVFIWSVLSQDYLFEKRIRKCEQRWMFGFRVLVADLKNFIPIFLQIIYSADLKTDHSLSAVFWNLDFLKIGLWIVRKYEEPPSCFFAIQNLDFFVRISDPHCLVSLNQTHLKLARTVAYNTHFNMAFICRQLLNYYC